jgi:hypothetical protein
MPGRGIPWAEQRQAGGLPPPTLGSAGPLPSQSTEGEPPLFRRRLITEPQVPVPESGGVVPPLAEGGRGTPRAVRKHWPGGGGCLMAYKGGLPPLESWCQNGASRRKSTGNSGSDGGTKGGIPLLMLREEGVGVRLQNGKPGGLLFFGWGITPLINVDQ